ncbi:MAG: lysylphosphatidylglycerol synthase transmembrane domain-containing protein [Halanaeroarchaeum sp.]
MSGVERRALLLGFGGAAVLIAGLLWLVDVGQVTDVVLRADPLLLTAMLGLAVLWLAAWGETLRTVLASMDVDVRARTAFFVYAAAVFANNVTPFGQAGGEPVTALLVSKVSGKRYETGLVSIASVDVLNALSSVALVFLGLGVYASRYTLGTSVTAAAGTIVALVVTIVTVFTFAWRFRERLVDRLAAPIASVINRLRRGPFAADSAVTAAGVAERLRHFVGNVEAVAGDRRRLLQALSLSTAGWLLQSAALIVAFSALGYTLPVAVSLFVIPLANLAGMAPLPGGLGGIEAAFVALLVPTTGIPAAAVTAAVLLFRVAIYWMPVVLGGSTASFYGAMELY